MSITRKALQGARDIIDPGAAKRRAAAEEAARIAAAERRLDLRWLMADARGRRIVGRLLARCHLLGNTFAHDQRLVDRAEGRRELALELFGEIAGAAPEEALAIFRADPVFLRAKEIEAQRVKDAGKA